MERTLETHGKLAAVKQLAKVTDHVVVSFSGGKDSLAVLALCKRFIPQVSAVFFYKFPNLTFEQDYLARVGRMLKVTIEQYPAPSLIALLQSGTYGSDRIRGTGAIVEPPWWRSKARESKMLNAFLLRSTGASYAAVGIKKYDTLVRYHTIYKQFGFMNTRDHIAYPVIDWKDSEVWSYIRLNRLPVNPIYARTGRSFGTLTPASLKAVRDLFPKDFKKIEALYPDIWASVVRGEEIERVKANRRAFVTERRKAANAAEASGVHDRASGSSEDQESAVQP